jgi:hypothetical protein
LRGQRGHGSFLKNDTKSLKKKGRYHEKNRLIISKIDKEGYGKRQAKRSSI